MAASAWRVYSEAKKYIMNGGLDMDQTLMRIKLVKGTAAAATSNYTLSTFASAGSGGAPSNMKTPHPKSLTGILITQGTSAKEIKFDSTDHVFTASGGNATSILYAVIGVSGGKALAWSKLTTTGSITINSGSTLTVQMNASGILTLTGGVT